MKSEAILRPTAPCGVSPPVGGPSLPARRFGPAWKAAFILLMGILLLQYSSRSEARHPNRPFSEFPLEIAGWTGEISYFDANVYDVLGVDDSFLASYRDSQNRLVQLYIGFYQSQRKGDLIHSPKNCMPGAGWRITEADVIPFREGTGPAGAAAARLTIRQGLHKQQVLYWFHSRGRVISNEYAQKIYLVIDAVTRGRTDGAFVRLISPETEGGQAAATDALLDFSQALMPVLSEFLPS